MVETSGRTSVPNSKLSTPPGTGPTFKLLQALAFVSCFFFLQFEAAFLLAGVNMTKITYLLPQWTLWVRLILLLELSSLVSSEAPLYTVPNEDRIPGQYIVVLKVS